MAAVSPPGPPGMRIEYNHDLDVSSDFLAAFPALDSILKDARLISEFRRFNAIAIRNKRVFHVVGFLSLLFGLVPLVLAAVRLTVGEDRFAHLQLINPIANAFGVAAILMVIVLRIGRFRRRWCQAIFCRERLRQWHFQKFIDGELISSVGHDPSGFQAELDRRWVHLQQNLRDGYGLMTQFVNFAAHDDDFFFEQTAYTDPGIAKEVFDALTTLRIDHQLRFSRGKIEPESEGTGFPLAERTTISETLATMTLVGAVFVTAVSAALPSLTPTFGAVVLTEFDRAFVGVALLLVVLSAATRAYRAGFTLPDEPESYGAYCDRVRELKAQFRAVSTDDERVRYLKQLEEESAAELRRYLRMKLRATFLM
jgi:hypothetical protein